MKLLLDTHIVIWWLAASPRLGKSAHTLTQENDCTVSVATFIESRFLALAGRARIPEVSTMIRHLEQDGISILPLAAGHVGESMRFEQSHPDIYDRLLLGAAIVENRTLLTRDAALLVLARKAKLAWVTEG